VTEILGGKPAYDKIPENNTAPGKFTAGDFNADGYGNGTLRPSSEVVTPWSTHIGDDVYNVSCPVSGQKYTPIIPPADMLGPSRKYSGITTVGGRLSAGGRGQPPAIRNALRDRSRHFQEVHSPMRIRSLVYSIVCGSAFAALASLTTQPRLAPYAGVKNNGQVLEAPPSPAPDERFKADILVVVAHPDDETMVSAYLAKAIYDEHKRVAVIYGTRGDGGGNAMGYEQAA